MNRMQKTGGIAAIANAAIFLAAMVVFFTLFSGDGSETNGDPFQDVAFVAENTNLLYTFYLVVYVAWAMLLVVVALAWHDLIAATSPALARIAMVFGVIWAGLIIATGMVAGIAFTVVADLYDADPVQAGQVWQIVTVVTRGIGGEIEIVGGAWILLGSIATVRAGGSAKALGYCGAAVAVAGLITVVPALRAVGGPIFGIGTTVWFAWLGVAILRRRP